MLTEPALPGSLPLSLHNFVFVTGMTKQSAEKIPIICVDDVPETAANKSPYVGQEQGK